MGSSGKLLCLWKNKKICSTHISDFWADPFVHLLLLKSSIPKLFRRRRWKLTVVYLLFVIQARSLWFWHLPFGLMWAFISFHYLKSCMLAPNCSPIHFRLLVQSRFKPCFMSGYFLLWSYDSMLETCMLLAGVRVSIIATRVGVYKKVHNMRLAMCRPKQTNWNHFMSVLETCMLLAGVRVPIIATIVEVYKKFITSGSPCVDQNKQIETISWVMSDTHPSEK